MIKFCRSEPFAYVDQDQAAVTPEASQMHFNVFAVRFPVNICRSQQLVGKPVG